MSVIIAAVIISFVGYFILSEAHTAATMCALLLVSELIQAGVKKLRGRAPEAKAQALAAAGVAGVLLFTLAAGRLDQKAAYGRAGAVIEAVERYQADKKALPSDLKELVPAYLERLPRAKHTLLWSGFHYKDGRLFWIATPILVTPEYDFTAKKWGFRRLVNW